MKDAILTGASLERVPKVYPAGIPLNVLLEYHWNHVLRRSIFQMSDR